MTTFSPDELKRLAGVEFNYLLQDDPVLKELESLKYDKRGHTYALLETLGVGDFRIGKLPVLPLTAAKWAFLWILGNGFVSDKSDRSDLSDTDLDIMLYVLSLQNLADIDCALHEIPAVAAGFRNIPGLPMADVIREINTMIAHSFLPLAMLSKTQSSSEEIYFDEMWLTAVAGCAARESGESLAYCIHKMSLSTVFALFVNYRRRKSTEKIAYPVPPEVEKQIADRIGQLGREFLTRP